MNTPRPAPGRPTRRWAEIRTLTGRMIADEQGMSTVEYAIGTVAAAAFGALLYTVVTGDNILSALTGIISRALTTDAG